MSKTVAITLLFILTLFSCCFTLQPVLGTTKLPTPELTAAYSDYSYDISAYPTTDPYTGHTVEVPATHIENKTIQFMIKSEASEARGQLHYIIRMKGHFSQNWTNIYNGRANGSEVTTWTFSTYRGQNIPGKTGYFYRGGDSFSLPVEGQLDFQVKAETWGEVMAETSATNPFGGSITTLFGESDWSNTQIINLKDNTKITITPTPITTPTPIVSSTPSLNPTTPTPSENETGTFANISWEITYLLSGLVATVAILAIGLLVLWRKVAAKGTN